jgi:hypothetical protein
VTLIDARYKLQFALALLLLIAPPALTADQVPPFEQMLPRIKPLEPQEALNAFRIEKGLRIELVAAECRCDPAPSRGRGRPAACASCGTILHAKWRAAGAIRMLEDVDGVLLRRHHLRRQHRLPWAWRAGWRNSLPRRDILYLKIRTAMGGDVIKKSSPDHGAISDFK